MSRRSRAIEIIESCRETHVWWSRWQWKNGKYWKRRVKQGAGAIGGPSFHRAWVKKYDFVLEVLRGG